MKNLRPCTVNGKKALFHTLEQYSKIVPPSLLVGGDNGGVVAEVLAIIEYEDGTLGRASITSLKFTDREADEPTPTQPSERKKPKEEKIRCPNCKSEDNKNATVFEDVENKEYFVYCMSCGIETVETYKSKKPAIEAFNNGKTKSIKPTKEV